MNMSNFSVPLKIQAQRQFEDTSKL